MPTRKAYIKIKDGFKVKVYETSAYKTYDELVYCKTFKTKDEAFKYCADKGIPIMNKGDFE